MVMSLHILTTAVGDMFPFHFIHKKTYMIIFVNNCVKQTQLTIDFSQDVPNYFCNRKL